MHTPKKEKIIKFSGAGVSAESGLKTFRDNNGLWENHKVTEVATPEAWKKDPEMVLRFYNMRRNQLQQVEPNPAHFALVELEKQFEVVVITQNIDDLHEQAGSSNVIHLHGELNKVRSEKYSNLIYKTNRDIKLGDQCEKGFQLRPHVVWFGEEVPMMDKAIRELINAKYLLVIGTSLSVYPAANIAHYFPKQNPAFLIDPNIPEIDFDSNWTLVKEVASVGVPIVVKKLLNKKGE